MLLVFLVKGKRCICKKVFYKHGQVGEIYGVFCFLQENLGNIKFSLAYDEER